MTPESRHAGHDGAILEARAEVYRLAKERNPGRWSGEVRNWTPIANVTLNPAPDEEARVSA